MPSGMFEAPPPGVLTIVIAALVDGEGCYVNQHRTQPCQRRVVVFGWCGRVGAT